MLENYLKDVISVCVQFFTQPQISAQKTKLGLLQQFGDADIPALPANLPTVTVEVTLPLLTALCHADLNKKEDVTSWQHLIDAIQERLISVANKLELLPGKFIDWANELNDINKSVTNIESDITREYLFLTKLLLENTSDYLGLQPLLTQLQNCIASDPQRKHHASSLSRLTNLNLSEMITKTFAATKQHCEQIKAKKTALAEMNKRIDAVANELAQLRANTSTLQTSSQYAEQLSAEHQRLRSQFATKEIELQQLRSNNLRMLNFFNLEMNDRDATISAQQSEIDALRKQLAAEQQARAEDAEKANSTESTLRAELEQLTRSHTDNKAAADVTIKQLNAKVAELEPNIALLADKEAELSTAKSEGTLSAEKIKQLNVEISNLEQIITPTLRKVFCLELTLNPDHFKHQRAHCYSKFSKEAPHTPAKVIESSESDQLFTSLMEDAKTHLHNNPLDAVGTIKKYIAAYKLASKDPRQELKKKKGLSVKKETVSKVSQREEAQAEITQLFKEYYNCRNGISDTDKSSKAKYYWRLSECINLLLQMPETIDPIFDLELYPDVLFNLFEFTLRKFENNERGVKASFVFKFYRWIVKNMAPLYVESENFESLLDLELAFEESYLISDYMNRLSDVLARIESQPKDHVGKKARLLKTPDSPVKTAARENELDKNDPTAQSWTTLLSGANKHLGNASTDKVEQSSTTLVAQRQPHHEDIKKDIEESASDAHKPVRRRRKKPDPSAKKPVKDTDSGTSNAIVISDVIDEDKTNVSSTHATPDVAAPSGPPSYPPPPPPSAPPPPPIPAFLQQQVVHRVNDNKASQLHDDAGLQTPPSSPGRAKAATLFSTPKPRFSDPHLAAIREGIRLNKTTFVSPSKRPKSTQMRGAAAVLATQMNKFLEKRRFALGEDSSNSDDDRSHDGFSSGEEETLPGLALK